jgi:broad specificity phosphatase PhoE
LQQARETGRFLDSLFAKEGITAENITWMSSPFLRCIQTSNAALDSFQSVQGAYHLDILPESSVFEWDGLGGKLHDGLPSLEERQHYFPRLKVDHESLFVPELPEPRAKFQSRCERVAAEMSKRYPYRSGTALVVVTHAAGCIGMASAASKRMYTEINPACPCSIYRLTRTADSDTWALDDHDAGDSMNGYTGHMANVGSSTVPWNHFGNKAVFHGYTGPAASRWAPNGYGAANAAHAQSNGARNEEL